MPLFDLHLHVEKRSPCSILSLVDLYDGLSDKLDGICITDHHVIDPLKGLSSLGITVLFGVEITTGEGDILAYGISKMPLKRDSAAEVINFIHKNDGVAVCAHPYSPRHFSFNDHLYEFDFDAIEVNGSMAKKYNVLAKRAAKIMDLPTIGGSDAHSKNQLNTMSTSFSIPIKTIEDVVYAIKNKKCKAVRVY